MAETSQISIQFGEEFDGNGKTNLLAELVVNTEEAQKKQAALQEITGGKFSSLDYCFVLVVEGADNEKLEEIAAILRQSDEAEEKYRNQRFFEKLDRALNKQSIWETAVHDGKFLMKLAPKEEEAEKLLMPFQMLLDSGLSELAQQQNNKVEAKILLNYDSQHIIDKIKAGDRILAPVLSQLRGELTLTLDQNLSEVLTNVLSQIDENLVSSPQLLFLKYFKNFDIHLTFNSAEELPEIIRQKILPGKKSQEDSDRRAMEFTENHQLLKEFIDALGQKITLNIIVPEFAAFSVALSAPGFSTLLINYLGYNLRNA